jgi:dienelactone hydrolase
MKSVATLLGGACALPAVPDKSAAVPHIHDQINKLAADAPLSMQFRGSTAEECRRWQREFRATLQPLLGSTAPPKQWDTVEERVIDLDDHRREELVLVAEGVPSLPVYLLTPRGTSSGRRPGVLALHGHGPFGHDSVVGIDTTPERRQDIERFRYDYGLQLARRGYTVAVPCFTPFGRRLDDAKAYGGDDACAVTFVRMQLLGKVLMAENLRDALWSLELLATRNEVDPKRLGCVGLSYGGRMTMLTSAFEPRVRVAVCSGALNIMQERITKRYSCGAQVIPGLLRYGDVPEIASLIAPRPCLWEVGSEDGLMVKDRIEPALERMRRAYRALSAEDQLKVDFFEGGHRWSGRLAYPLLEKVLEPGRTT